VLDSDALLAFDGRMQSKYAESASNGTLSRSGPLAAATRSRAAVRVSLALVSLGILGAGFVAGCRNGGGAALPTAAALPNPSAPAAELFQRHCAICHGPAGRGDGAARELLYPAPRDFGHGKFRLVSTVSRAPSRESVQQVLERGLPGTGMPSFAWMPPQDVAALSEHVLELAHMGLAARLADELRLDAAAARALAEQRLQPGPPLELPPEVAATPQVLARGQRTYVARCASCHGVDGRNQTLEPRWNVDGDIDWPRDFPSGVLRGGASYDELARRILCGMPGTSMPAHTFASRDELPALVAYVQSLIPRGQDERLVQRRREIVAPRVVHLPAAADDVLWSLAREEELVLAPLSWHADAPLYARISALHDGERIALRLRWQDASCDSLAGRASADGDGAAVALSNESAPPLFGMGSPEHPVNLWHWSAFETGEISSLLERVLPSPHRGGAELDVPLYRPALGLYTPSQQADEAEARGHDDVRALRDAVDVAALPRWRGGEWTLVLQRRLHADGAGALELAPGRSVQLACALWNGSIGQRGGRKSISIWHALTLER
jgi:DMSO reductase family type II enzyme heme b subunit